MIDFRNCEGMTAEELLAKIEAAKKKIQDHIKECEAEPLVIKGEYLNCGGNWRAIMNKREALKKNKKIEESIVIENTKKDEIDKEIDDFETWLKDNIK